MKECVQLMNRMEVDFWVELSDYKDQDTPPDKKNTLLYLKTIENVYKHFKERLCVNKAAEVRKLLDRSGKMLAFFQGHNHCGHYIEGERINYFTLKASDILEVL